VIEVRQTDVFDRWFRKLRDRQAKARIHARIDRLALGLAGEVKPIGEGISELRIDHGPGYRVYFVRHGEAAVVLLIGGDKTTQTRDIATAFALARSL
jgi:putative addiction module killer protein